MQLFTLGHSNHPFNKFLWLLESHRVATLVDVRSVPFSRHNPQFRKDVLEQTLLQARIRYVFAGKYLGGRPTDPTCYKLQTAGLINSRRLDYSVVMEREWFINAIQRLMEIAKQQTTAILCSEEDPAHCHRHHLITTYLLQRYPDLTIKHIRGDGSLLDAMALVEELNQHRESEQPPLFSGL